MRNVIERETRNGYVIEITPDDYSESPRDWDNLGVFVAWHPRYNLGDVNVSPRDDVARELPAPSEPAIMLPVYAYEHSGITIRAGGAGPLPYPFTDPWDSGQVGVIWITLARVREEYSAKRVSRKLRARVAEALRQEIDTLDQFLTGQVYCYSVKNPRGIIVDSCCGMFGLDYALEEARAEADRRPAPRRWQTFAGRNGRSIRVIGLAQKKAS